MGSPAPRIRTVDDLRLLKNKRVVCLASGGVDSSFVLFELSSVGAIVTPLFIETIPRAMRNEALVRVCTALSLNPTIVDAVHRFADDFIAPAIRAHAIYLDAHPISSSLSRPLFAQIALEQAVAVGAEAIVHSATPSQNSLRRFNTALTDLGFSGAFGSPFEASPVSRAAKIAALRSLGFSESSCAYSVDENAWARCVESGTLDDPERDWDDPQARRWTREEVAAAPAAITIGFERGRPCHLNGVRTDLPALVAALNALGGGFGIGRYRALEENALGYKVQESREAPAAALLLEGYRRVEAACVDAASLHHKLAVEQLWVCEAVEGRWFGRLRRAADAFIAELAASVNGDVDLELRSGGIRYKSVRAPKPLYVRSREPGTDSID